MIEDDLSSNFIVKIDNLKPFTKYNCTASLKNKVGWSNESGNVIFTTLGDGKYVDDIINFKKI